MKSLLIDIIGLIGFMLLSFGLYLNYGIAITLQIIGFLILIFSIIVSRRIKRDT